MTWIKRLFDIILSITILLSLSPILFIISFIILIFDGRPILFKQNRSGLNQQTFIFHKFKTMKPHTNEFGVVLQDVDRITPFGRFLRKTSLDELPSFLSVLKGDMSVVGPRPLLERYLSRYDEYQIRRLEVKPGITGLAQIKGRNKLSWDEKFFFDVNYIENQSLLFDIKIILITVISVFSMNGISTNNQEIMPEFKGTKKNESSNLKNNPN